ncbi:MAG: hypothetical protein FWF02_12615, partial [Micrococcales bacterium]|nr:hypothetical protein [Micrococcales bacterium]MCL2668520.1 hypothetical protein [Micrococcales bacterium]
HHHPSISPDHDQLVNPARHPGDQSPSSWSVSGDRKRLPVGSTQRVGPMNGGARLVWHAGREPGGEAGSMTETIAPMVLEEDDR